MKLLLFNLATDSLDPILGFTTRWIEALAKRVEVIHVITMRAGRIQVPSNVRVYSVGKDKGYSEPRRAVEFYRRLFRVLREDGIDICFSHMIPIFTVLAAPLLKLKGIPIVTWYAHPNVPGILKLAHHLSDRMVNSVASLYGYRREKLTALGQGIDTAFFCPDVSVVPEKPPIILCVGRLSPSKCHPTLLEACALLRQRGRHPFRAVIIGSAAGAQDVPYVTSLYRQLREMDLETVVRFEHHVAVADLLVWYRRCTVHVNLKPTGFMDKTALEAMACGRPSLVASEEYRETLGRWWNRLFFQYENPQDLADRLEWLMSVRDDERLQIGDELRGNVIRLHDLDRLADQLVLLFRKLIDGTLIN